MKRVLNTDVVLYIYIYIYIYILERKRGPNERYTANTKHHVSINHIRKGIDRMLRY